METSPAVPGRDPRQPWLNEWGNTVWGPATVVAERSGDLGEPGTGVYVDDLRVLSVATLTVAGEPPSPIAASFAGPRAAHLLAARHLGDRGADPTVLIERTRELTDAGLSEELRISSRARQAVTTEVAIELAADGAHLSAVKSGHPPTRPIAAEAVGAAVRWVHRDLLVELSAPRARIDVHGPRVRVAWRVTVPPGQAQVLRLAVTWHRTAVSTFDARSAAGRVRWDDVRVEAVDGRLAPLVAASLADLSGLLMTDPAARDGFFVAAGSPWYLTLFGRDSLWAARLLLPFGTELAAGTLRSLAHRQGRTTDPVTQEEPGKILHEVRREVFADETTGMALPPLYYGTVDATALWCLVLCEAWRFGMPVEQVRELLPALRAGLGWLVRCAGSSPDGFLRYLDSSGHGLANQGWKDSDDAMRRADGSIAPGPIALLEAQAYAVAAARSGHDLLTALEPDVPPAHDLPAWADELTARVRSRYWCADDAGGHPAMAIDGEGLAVDGVSSNMGHALATGVFDERQSARIVELLCAEAMFGTFGIRTLARDNPGYNPIGYHTGSIWAHDTAICMLGASGAGFPDHAARIARSLLAAGAAFGSRLPELWSGDTLLAAPAPYPASCLPQAWAASSFGALVTAMLGLTVDVPGRRLGLRPMRPSPVGAWQVTGLRFGEARFAVRVDADGSACVTGLPDDVVVDLPEGSPPA